MRRSRASVCWLRASCAASIEGGIGYVKANRDGAGRGIISAAGGRVDRIAPFRVTRSKFEAKPAVGASNQDSHRVEIRRKGLWMQYCGTKGVIGRPPARDTHHKYHRRGELTPKGQGTVLIIVFHQAVRDASQDPCSQVKHARSARPILQARTCDSYSNLRKRGVNWSALRPKKGSGQELGRPLSDRRGSDGPVPDQKRLMHGFSYYWCRIAPVQRHALTAAVNQH